MPLTLNIHPGSDLSQDEKADIISRMSAMKNPGERNNARKSLAQQYGVREGTISSLIAHETMRRAKKLEGSLGNSQEGEQSIALIDTKELQSNPTQTVQRSTQARVYTITSLSEITEEMRVGIFQDFTTVIQDNATNTRYDFYIDIEAISDYYSIDPAILEQFLRNRYTWLSSRLDELKKGRIISEEEKMSIRLYVESGIDDKDKKTKRKEMAQKYGVSIYVIGAITAWKVAENGEKILNKSGSSIEGVPNDVPKGGVDEVTMGEDISPLEQITPQVNIAGEDTLLEEVFSGEDRKFIQELAQDFDLNNDGKRAIFLQDVFDCFPEATIEHIKNIIPYLPDDQSHVNIKRSGEGMGALVNYNNEIKNKWRGKIKEFIDANTDPEKRKDMKVICLPGVECLEIPLYLELGFRPENIIGIEAGMVKGKKDPELIALFQANADKYGIQTRIGKLEKVLETEETVFDIVSLDFLGPPSQTTFVSFNRIKISKEGLVLTNFLNKRESSSKYLLDEYSVLYDTRSGEVNSPKENPYYGLGMFTQDEPVRKSSNYNIKMQGGLGRLVVSSILGIQDADKGYFINKYIPTLQNTESVMQLFSFLKEIKFIHPDTLPNVATYEVKKYIMVVAHKFLINFLRDQHMSDKLINEMTDYMLGALTDLIIMKPGVLGHKLYNYKGENGSVMISDFLALGGNGVDKKANFKKLNYFLANLMELAMNISISETKGENKHSMVLGVDRNGRRGMYQFGPKDNLYIKVDGKIMHQIKATDFFGGYDNFVKYWQSIACNYTSEYTIIR